MLNAYPDFVPEVSVIMATYNRASLLPRAINSVLTQTGVSFELIVIDDGSSDDTFELMRTYTDAHANIRYVRHKNRGQSLSVNSGISLALGEYLTFLDSDDEYLPNHLLGRWQFMQQNPTVDLGFGGLEIIGNPYLKDRKDPSKLVHIDECAGLASFFAKKYVFEKLDGFANMLYSADGDLMERAQQFFVTKRFTENTYRYYRDTPDSICNNM